MRALPAALVLVMATASAAHAEPAQNLRDAVFGKPAPVAIVPMSRAPEPLAAGLAQTSIERRFAHDRASGAVGFLCGRDEDHGASTPFGDDPHGRFVGARLSLKLP